VSGPVRTLVVRGLDWPVVAAGPAGPEPVAVVRANRVVAASAAARADGVAPGQRRREAQGRCPALVMVDHDPERDIRVFAAVAAEVEAFTPRLELSRPGVCALATRGPSRYFGGDQALATQIHQRVEGVLADRGWSGVARVGVADGPFAADLAADRADDEARDRADPVRVIPPGATPAFLAPLPVTTLVTGLASLGGPGGAAEDLVDVLARLGLRTLGALAQVPAGDVVARFGVAGQLAHRLARGLDPRLPDTRLPPPHLLVEALLDPPVERVDAAAFTAKALADDLHAQLDRRGLACTRVAVLAETEHGESNQRLWRHEGSLSPSAIADRVRWQLDGWLNAAAAHRPTSGITRLALVPDEVVAASGRQLGFWGGETAVDERAIRAFARIQGLLGPDSVTVPQWRGGRGPGEQIGRVPTHAVDLGDPDRVTRAGRGKVQPPWPGQVPPPAPATVPAAQQVACQVVDIDGEVVWVGGRGAPSAGPARMSVQGGPWVDVVGWAGPWPVDERWWDPPAHRRRARFQVVAADDRAHLLVVENGRWWVEATYD
jgi:protein ImuB